MIEMDKQAISYHPNGATHFAGSTEHNTRPAPDTPDELIWLRGFEAGVIRCRADRNQVIRELIEKAESEAKSTGIEYQYTWRAQVAWWLKAQMEGE